MEFQLRSLFALGQRKQLRSFACECCERLLAIWDDPALRGLISLARERIYRDVTQEELNAWLLRFDPVYDSYYPGYGDPSMPALCLAAAGEAIFTASPLDAAINAANFAAEAMAKNAASHGDDADYDQRFDEGYNSERDQQSELLTKLSQDWDRRDLTGFPQ